MEVAAWQREAARAGPPVWVGAEDEDATSQWAGLLLRTEQIGGDWWWSVWDEAAKREVDSSVYYPEQLTRGPEARRLAEASAYAWMGVERPAEA